MSYIDADLRTLLLAQAQIAALATGGIWVDEAEQGAALPYVVIVETDTEGNTSLDGSTDNLQFVTYDIDCYAQTANKAIQLRDAIRSFIKDYSGATGGTQTIAAVLVNGSASDRIPASDGKGQGTFIRTLDVDIQYNPV